MRRKIYSPEHELFREQFRLFLGREVVPFYDEWEKAGVVPRAAWKKAGAAGFLCPWLPEQFGGSGADFLYSAVMMEEMGLANVIGFFLTMHSDIVVPYIASFGNDGQKRKWLPGCASGDLIAAVAMSEPDTGSDLQAIRARAVLDGDHYIINGQKTFVSNGLSCGLCVTAVKTDPAAQPAHRGISLIVVEDGTPGFEKGRKLDKIGLRCQDTAELSFTDCRVPRANLLGAEGEGFKQLMSKLQQERLVVAVWCGAMMKAALRCTAAYIKERAAFGKPVARFQNTRFTMAELYTISEIAEVFLDRLVEAHAAGDAVNTETSMAKLWIGANLNYLVDRCLQFFGGYGYMEEYPIARMYRDARVQTIFAGTSEIMKEIIARDKLGRD